MKGVFIMRFTNSVKRFFTAFLAIVMIFAVVPFAASAADDTIKQIHSYLVNEMGLTPAAACGVLANIECESDFNCNLYGDNGSSYGICQWHNERLTNMKNYCAKNGYDYKSLDGQLHFLEYELSTNKSDTGYILDKLKGVSNDAEGAYRAGYDWCYYFERPSNRTAKAETRGNKAKNYYWPNYNTVPQTTKPTTTKPTTTQPEKVTYGIGDINKDGRINSADALLAIEHSVGSRKLTSSQIKLADINKDSKVTSSDAFIILSISTGADNINNYQ